MESFLGSSPYPALYLVTLAVHLLIVSFPLGAAVLLPFLEATPTKTARLLRQLLTHYLPFSIGIAITAGVAPLLFVSLAHPGPFYIAGVILGPWRVGVLLPLAIAFYLSYLQKTDAFATWPLSARLTVRLGLFAGLFAVGALFTISRQVGLEADEWSRRYVSFGLEGGWLWSLTLRYLLVVLGAVVGAGIWTVMALARWEQRGRLSPGERVTAEDTLLWIVLPPAGGLCLAFFLTVGDLEWPWLKSVLLAGSLVCTGGLGLRIFRIPGARWLAPMGYSVALGVLLLIREGHRLGRLGDHLSLEVAEYAASRPGVGLFIIFATLCALGMGAAIHLTLRAPEDMETTS